MQTSVYLILFCCLYIGQVFAQSLQPALRNYSVEDGLPSSEVYHTIQDSRGYMWFATDMGVSRYDGYEFRNFSMADGLPDNTVFNIYEDYQERIWFITNSGKLAYFKNDVIWPYEHNSKLQEHFQELDKSSFYVDRDDNLYISVFGAGYFVVSDEGEVKQFINPGIRTFEIFDKDSIGVLLAFSYGVPKKTLIKLNGNHFTSEILFEHGLYDRNATALKRNNGTFLFAIQDMLIEIVNAEEHSTIDLDAKSISLFEDSEGGVWIGYFKKGVDLLDKSKLDHPVMNILNGLSVSSILEDQEGGYWLTTLESGVYYFPSKHILSISRNTGLEDERLLSITSDGASTVFAGTSNSSLLIIRSDRVASLDVPKSGKIPKYVNALFYDIDQKELHIGLSSKKYQILDPIGMKFRTTGNMITTYDVMKRKDKGIWAGTAYSVRQLVGNEWTCPTCKEDNLKVGSFDVKKENNKIGAIYEDQNGQLWVGNLGGLGKYQDGQILFDENRPDLLKIRVTGITETPNGILCIATRGGGVLFLKNDSVYQINTTNGLTGDNINHILVEDQVIWTSTNNGLNKVSFSSYNDFEYQIETYTTIDGLTDNEVTETTLLNDRLWVATRRGLSVFKPDRTGPCNTPPPIYITDISGFEYYSGRREYDLTYDQNSFVISFIGLSYKDPGNLTYEYKMHGVDSSWHSTSNTSVQYTTLPHGQYQFYIKAVNYDGYASAEAAILRFHISPPFWQTWWFKALAVFAFISVLWLLFYSYYKRLRARHEMEKSVLELEAKALRAQMNPHFIFNSLNSIQSYISANDSETAERYLAKFARLVRLILDNSRKPHISLDLEITTLQYYLEFEKARFKDRFDFSIHVDPAIDPEFVLIPPMLIQPFVENSVIHGFAKKEKGATINIGFGLTNSVILCTVEDNGIGREMAARLKKQQKNEHVSVGMQITKERLKMMGAAVEANTGVNIIDLKDDQGNSQGTKIEIFIPFMEK